MGEFGVCICDRLDIWGGMGNCDFDRCKVHGGTEWNTSPTE